MKLKERVKMLKFEMNELREVSEDDLVKMIGYDISEWFEVFESGVYKVNYGSRGEIEEVVKVEVKDGMFEVESEEEILNSMDEESREEMKDWVVVELDDGVLCISRGEEDNDEYYLVK